MLTDPRGAIISVDLIISDAMLNNEQMKNKMVGKSLKT